jgi:hypothetical protein
MKPTTPFFCPGAQFPRRKCPVRPTGGVLHRETLGDQGGLILTIKAGVKVGIEEV